MNGGILSSTLAGRFLAQRRRIGRAKRMIDPIKEVIAATPHANSERDRMLRGAASELPSALRILPN